jgi:hypothetical protein
MVSHVFLHVIVTKNNSVLVSCVFFRMSVKGTKFTVSEVSNVYMVVRFICFCLIL